VTALVLVGLGALLAVGALLAARGARRLPGRALGGGALILAAVVLAALRQFALAAPVGFLGLALLRGGLAGPVAAPIPGGASEVRTEALAMSLEHDTGEMDGEVLRGRFCGAFLSQLSAEDLQALVEELEDDHDSLGLLLAYLDRRRGAARDAGAGAGAGAGAAPPGGAGGEMSAAEALRILGLAPGASPADVRAAHRRLMKRVHPDLGGSDALAAMINAAKARLDP
jgi:DnaJ-domain-containing protein 1